MYMFACFLVRFFFNLKKKFLQGGQQCSALGLWAFLAACPCTLFIDIISLCLLIGQIKMLACLLSSVCSKNIVHFIQSWFLTHHQTAQVDLSPL